MFPRERGTSGSARSARDQDEADASRSGPPSSVPDAANSSRPERARPLGADVQRPEPVGAAAAAAPQGPGAAATPSWPPAPRPPPPQGWQGAGRHDGGRGVQPELGYIRRQLQAVVIGWGRAQKTEREREYKTDQGGRGLGTIDFATHANQTREFAAGRKCFCATSTSTTTALRETGLVETGRICSVRTG